ncbi:MAG: response regulator transcription factor [Chitinophagales bacterium]|nr:response regulator transcription factor [Chitinophagales bacterium]
MQPSIIIADDHSMIRKGMKLLLQASLGYTDVRETTTCNALMMELMKRDCSHLILDIIFSDGTALEVIGNIRRLYPSLNVMVFSMQLAEVYAEAFRQYDVHYFMSKSSSEEMTIMMLKKFLHNEAPPVIEMNAINQKNPFSSLSPRELEVIHYLLNGHQTKAIAKTLNLGMSTVSTLKKRIFEKTETENLKQLMELASLYDINF